MSIYRNEKRDWIFDKMKIFRFAAAYFRQYRKLIILLCLFAVIFAVVFLLYQLEIEAVLYAALLCAIVGLMVLGIDFIWLYKKHLRLTALAKNSFINLRDLPASIKVIEQDYADLIEKLCGDNNKQRYDFHQSRRGMEEYYTLWAHQIKSPVAAMRLLLQSEDTPQNAALLLELFKIEQYVEMVLSYVRLESENSDFVINRYPLNEIVRGAVRKYAPMFIRKKISLELAEIKGDVLTDEKWLAFVVEQVLSNSLKYTNAGKIAIYTKGNTLIMEDSGIGIAAEDLPRIGQKGFTGYNGRADKKATGIGLFLCKTVCAKLGHNFTVQSQVGVGTKVSIALDNAAVVVE